MSFTFEVLETLAVTPNFYYLEASFKEVDLERNEISKGFNNKYKRILDYISSIILKDVTYINVELLCLYIVKRICENLIY